MAVATFRIKKAKEREDGWHHPVNGSFLKESELDVYVFEIINADDNSVMMSLVLDRNCVEQLAYDAEQVVTTDPLVVRLCQP